MALGGPVVTFSDEEILDRISKAAAPTLNISPPMVQKSGFQAAESADPPESLAPPTSEAIQRWVDYASNPEQRWQTGFRGIDILTRGLGRGELMQVVGKSHSGKSQWLYNCIVRSLLNDEHFRGVIYSPDEPTELVVAKLYSIMFGVNGADVEKQLRQGDKTLIGHLQDLGKPGNFFDKIRIYDGAPTFNLMHDVLAEAQDGWGEEATLLMVDYLELLRGNGRRSSSEVGNVQALAQGLKQFAKDVRLPVAFVHQAGRGSGDRGKSAGISAGKYGGEAESMFIYEVWRERENTSHIGEMKRLHENSISVGLWKNKRPPGRLDQFTFYLDPDTGHIDEMTEDRLVG